MTTLQRLDRVQLIERASNGLPALGNYGMLTEDPDSDGFVSVCMDDGEQFHLKVAHLEFVSRDNELLEKEKRVLGAILGRIGAIVDDVRPITQLEKDAPCDLRGCTKCERVAKK